MIKLKRYTLTLALLTFFTVTAMAQPEDPDAPTPFGFVEILVAAGALYGGKKVYKATRKQE